LYWKNTDDGEYIMLVKICGLTRTEEADHLNEYGADLAGFVLFFPKSKRNISIDQAKLIMNKLDTSIKTVAVTVSPTAEQLSEIVSAGFDYVQIHGEITDELLSDISIPVIKAFNVSDMDKYEYYHSRPEIIGYVFDAQIPGSGTTFDWQLVKNIPRDEKLFILAGGLNPDNVADAVSVLHPDGVDVSSGVEYPGDIFRGKDPELIAEFVRNAK
jgi:phosphoribosylanthranilate isomerase